LGTADLGVNGSERAIDAPWRDCPRQTGRRSSYGCNSVCRGGVGATLGGTSTKTMTLVATVSSPHVALHHGIWARPDRRAGRSNKGRKFWCQVDSFAVPVGPWLGWPCVGAFPVWP
jgi:hypothetical protein